MLSCRKTKYLQVVAGVALAFVGCASPRPAAVFVPETQYVLVDKAAVIPPGVLRYCWEEPMVELERNGPGLDVEGNWYHPYYIAVREVRHGRYRPCVRETSEVLGDSNER